MGYREKMSRELRAKQFMPFAALKGHSEALREMERIPAPRKEFSEEYQEELDRGLRQIRRNDAVRIVYYADGEYRELMGNVSIRRRKPWWWEITGYRCGISVRW